MKFFLVLLAIVAAVAAYDIEFMGEEDWKNFFEDESKLKYYIFLYNNKLYLSCVTTTDKYNNSSK